MDLMKIAAQLFMSKLGSSGNGLDAGAVVSALSGLMGNGDGGIDLGGILSKVNGEGLASMAASWLGDGGNEAISANQITKMFGENAVSGFASKLGLNTEAATDGLAGMIPDLLDQNSKGGSLLDMVGGAEGLMGMAKKLF